MTNPIDPTAQTQANQALATQAAADAALETAHRAADTTRINQLNAQHTADLATIANLQQQLNQGGQPQSTRTDFGLAVVGGTLAEFQRVFALMGNNAAHHPDYIRAYHAPGQMPATWQDSDGGKVGDALGVGCWLSLKPGVDAFNSGTLDSWWTTFLKSIPQKSNNNRKYILTLQHEPDNPSKNIDGAEFCSMINRAGNLAKIWAPQIDFCPIYMDYQENLAGGPAAPGQYYNTIDPTKITAWGQDPYSQAATNTWALAAQPLMTKLTQKAALPFLTGEWAIMPANANNNRPQSIINALAAGPGKNTRVICYFSNEGWYLTDAEFQALGPLLAARPA